MNQPAAEPAPSGAVSLAQSSPTVGTFRERDGALEWSGRQETLRVEPWGPDAIRVRARLGGPVLADLPGALAGSDAPKAPHGIEIEDGRGRLTVGAIAAEVSAGGQVRFVRTADGTDLLVAPVLTAGARTRTAYLPAGAWWTDAWTGETYEGGTAVTVDAPLERIPLFLRDGARLPVTKDGTAR